MLLPGGTRQRPPQALHHRPSYRPPKACRDLALGRPRRNNATAAISNGRAYHGQTEILDRLFSYACSKFPLLSAGNALSEATARLVMATDDDKSSVSVKHTCRACMACRWIPAPGSHVLSRGFGNGASLPSVTCNSWSTSSFYFAFWSILMEAWRGDRSGRISQQATPQQRSVRAKKLFTLAPPPLRGGASSFEQWCRPL